MPYRNATVVLSLLLPVLALGEGGAGASPAPPAATRSDDAAGVRTLEDRVAELREKIQRTRARLPEVEGGETSASASPILIVHRNEFDMAYRLEAARYVLDGEPIYVKQDLEGDLAGRKSFEAYDAPIPAGVHRLTVEIVYTAASRRQADVARFTLRETYDFQSTPGRAVVVTVAAGVRDAVAGSQPRPSIRIGHALRSEAPAPPGD